MELKLFENALDFIDTAVEYANTGEAPRNLKYAVINLYNGIEVLLKTRLMKEDWQLIFENLNKANVKALKSGQFQSVGLETAIDRLESECFISIKEDRKRILKELKTIRNRTMHYEFSGTKRSIYPIIIKVWAFAIDFIGEHLSDAMTTNEEFLISKIRTNITENIEFVNNRKKEIAPILKQKMSEDYVSIIVCPVCFESALILSEELHMCAFCGYGGPHESILDKWCTAFIGYPYTDPKERSLEEVVYFCQECFNEALVQIPDEGNAEPPDPGWVCFACGSSYAWGELELCPRCDQPYTVDPDGVPFCSDCFGRMIERD